MELSKRELLSITGGISITAALLTAFVRGASTFFDIGRSLGSSLRRFYTGNVCKF